MDIFVNPDWSDGVKESFEFNTTIFASDSGREQRTVERMNARRSISYTALLHKDRLRDLKALLHSRSDTMLYIPEPVHQVSQVAVYAPLGATSVQFADTIPVEYVGLRVCIHGRNRAFFGTVETVAAKTITFTGPIEGEAVVGDALRLCIVGRMPASAKISHVTDDIAYFAVEFDQNPGQKNRNFGTASFPIWRGREVLTESPNWAAPPAVDVIGEYEVTDFGRGVVETYSPIDFVSKVTQFTFLGRSTTKMHRLMDFHARQLGRCGEFWCPSWTSELRLADPISSGTNAIRVAGRAAADHYTSSTVERAVAIKHSGGWLYRYITGITTDGTNSTITFSENFTFDVALSNVIGLYWLNVSRFASDTMTVQWITDEIAQTVFQITTLEALPAEVV